LKRRFAKLAEIEKIWEPSPAKDTAEEGGVFGHLKAKDSSAVSPVEAPASTMTWAKFSRDVLPSADMIEFLSPHRATSYSAILTAEDESAPPILQWDAEEKRNPFSWYLYNGGSSARDWSLQAGMFQKVNAICFQPSMWNGSNNTHQGAGIMFILDGAKDLRSSNAGNGLFPEILKSELHGIRSVLEAYSKGAEISGLDEANACGLMLQKGNNWSAVFKVTSDGIVSKYNLDRWD
jgi:hypothetical protein